MWYWRLRADERLGNPAPKRIREPLVVKDRVEDPQEDPMAMHLFGVWRYALLWVSLG